MLRGLYVAASGMIAETNRTDTIANNLANADTNGFKKDVAINKEFEPMYIRRINDEDPRLDVTSFKRFSLHKRPPRVGTLGLGAAIAEIATDHEQGALKTTGNPLDLAIAGNGYFGVQTDQGVRYTRDGAFFRSSTGELQNMKGQAVLNTQGRPITIPADATSINISPQGEIYADGQRVSQLMFVDFGPDRRAILKQGDNLWNPREGANPQPAEGEIQQGFLEASNTNVVSEMVELVNNYRIYEAGSKAVTTQDTLLDKAVNEIGRLS
ncbi:MAG: flagellar hook-basal body protein [Selenomonadaceae bacterium]|nr:flagellar hook-basal body protein [Selenomonadaceae bacterium]